MTTIEVLKAARAKIEKPEMWCQGYYAVNQYGSRVPEYDPNACRWCAVGAIWLACGLGETTRVSAACERLSDFTERRMSASDFNDTHTHTEVLALFDKAIAAEEAKAEVPQ